MAQYINTIKDLIDLILATGDDLNDKDQMLYVIEGLDSKYIGYHYNTKETHTEP